MLLEKARAVKLHRHQLLRLNAAGWRRALARDWDEEARHCLSHWASKGLPLVVTRQPEGLLDGVIAAGLAAPTRWGRRHLVLQVARSDVLFFDEFPRIRAITAQIPEAARAPWQALCASLDDIGVGARVYGSHGWQCLSGLRYVHRDSDIDLCLPMGDADQAEAVILALDRFAAIGRPRIDGEFLFGDGTACAWREWQAWHEGRCARLLSKSLHGPSLVGGAALCSRAIEKALP